MWHGWIDCVELCGYLTKFIVGPQLGWWEWLMFQTKDKIEITWRPIWTSFFPKTRGPQKKTATKWAMFFPVSPVCDWTWVGWERVCGSFSVGNRFCRWNNFCCRMWLPRVGPDGGHLGDFVEGLGPSQLVGRQVLGSPCLGEIQLSLFDRKGHLEVEVIRARGLSSKPGTKLLPGRHQELRKSLSVWKTTSHDLLSLEPIAFLSIRTSLLFFSAAPYVKVYLMEGKNCKEKQKTNIARRTLDPLYQEHLYFTQPYGGCILQVCTGCSCSVCVLFHFSCLTSGQNIYLPSSLPVCVRLHCEALFSFAWTVLFIIYCCTQCAKETLPDHLSSLRMCSYSSSFIVRRQLLWNLHNCLVCTWRIILSVLPWHREKSAHCLPTPMMDTCFSITHVLPRWLLNLQQI